METYNMLNETINNLNNQLRIKRREYQKIAFVKGYLESKEFQHTKDGRYGDITKSKYLVDWRLTLDYQGFRLDTFETDPDDINKVMTHIEENKNNYDTFHSKLTLSDLYDAIKEKADRNILITGISHMEPKTDGWSQQQRSWRSLIIEGVFPNHNKVQQFMVKDPVHSYITNRFERRGKYPHMLPGTVHSDIKFVSISSHADYVGYTLN